MCYNYTDVRISLTWLTYFSLLGCYTRLLDPGIYNTNPSIHEQGIQQENLLKFLCLHVAQEVGPWCISGYGFPSMYSSALIFWAVLKSRVYVVVQE